MPRLAQQYEAAFDFFRQAYQLKPKDLRYRAAFEHSRFDAGAEAVHRGQQLREEGKLQEALAEFQKAAAIDPSSVHCEAGNHAHVEDDQRSAEPGSRRRPACRVLWNARSTRLAARWNLPHLQRAGHAEDAQHEDRMSSIALWDSWQESMYCSTLITHRGRLTSI